MYENDICDNDFVNIYEDLCAPDMPILNDYANDNCYFQQEWESCFLPSAISKLPLQRSIPSTPEKGTIGPAICNNLLQSIKIEETFSELESEDHICLEDALEEINDDQSSSVILPSTSEMVYFKRDYDLYSKEDLDDDAIESTVTFNDDEYLCLGYSKIPPFTDYKKDSSLSWILRQYLGEVFKMLEFPSVERLKKKGLIPKSYFVETESFGPTLTSREVSFISFHLFF